MSNEFHTLIATSIFFAITTKSHHREIAEDNRFINIIFSTAFMFNLLLLDRTVNLIQELKVIDKMRLKSKAIADTIFFL